MPNRSMKVFVCGQMAILAGLALFASPANATIIGGVTLDATNANTATAIGNDANDIINGAGLSAPLNGGESLATALGVTHIFDGTHTESFVTNASAPDYFTAGQLPVLVFDLQSDQNLRSILLWQYQNNGGNGTNVGNHARDIELRFNTAAEGNTAFAGPAANIRMEPVLSPNTNSPQGFNFGTVTGRYVQMALTDNHFGDPDGFGVGTGGDRVGLGEVRFSTEAFAAADFEFEIDRDTRDITLRNTGNLDGNITGYSLLSNAGSLNGSNATWLSIADNYDANDDMSVDPDDNWIEFSSSDTDLSEGSLGAATITPTEDVVLGAAWRRSPYEDVTFEVLLDSGITVTGAATFVGTEAKLADFDDDGDVDLTDFSTYNAGLFSDLSDLTPYESYQQGDLDGDGDNDRFDFLLFKNAYIAEGGSAASLAFAGGTVPEPNNLVFAIFGGMVLAIVLRSHRVASHAFRMLDRAC